MSSEKKSAPGSMTVAEVQEVALELQSWIGSQLQEVMIDGIKGEDPRSLRLGFYGSGEVRWVVFDYRIQAPLLLLFDGRDGVPRTPPKTAGKIRRPIELFLRSKHVGRRLREIRRHADDGRALDLVFDPNEDGGEVLLELKIYPHGRNARAVSGPQSVSEFKPLAPKGGVATAPGRSGRNFEALEHPLRSRRELVFEWMGFVKPAKMHASAAAPSSGAKSPLQIKIEKKQKAKAKVMAEIEAKESSPAREIGEWLKANQTLEIPPEWPPAWRELVDSKRSLSVNIERLFTLAKSQTRKLEGTRDRVRELAREIEALQKKIEKGDVHEESNRGRGERLDGSSKDLFIQADAKGRKFQMAEDLIVYLGKNAAENLAILRKAQPFDYWLHLKDRPGAHAILRRARGRVVTDAELIKAGIYVAEQTMKRRAIEMKGEAFDLLIVECRFVRPIKGDHLGRVHYTHDRVLRLSL